MEWKTLQEVFEENGNVFPFTVLANTSELIYKENEKVVPITFTSKEDNEVNGMCWYPKDYKLDSTDENGILIQMHFVWAKRKAYYSYKGEQFDKDMEKLLK